MPVRNLEKLFYPRSVAVIGASNRDGLPGHLVMQNLLQGGFEGPIMPVSAKEQAVSGVLAYPRIDALPMTPDLAVVCNSCVTDPSIIRDLGERGTGAAILIGDDPSPTKSLASEKCLPVMDEARRFGLRLLGPDCLGVMVPGIGLNASAAHVSALPGGIAFVSQSATIGTAVLDWARDRDIGFSYFISLGHTADVDFGDVLDYLGNDPMTRAILLYVESIHHGRSFMSAGRGASRNKPVLVIKSGRTAEGERAAFGQQMIRGDDDVYDAAFRRAGMLRVDSFSELFAAVETLGRIRLVKAERLAMIANGRGIAALAVDSLVQGGGSLAALSDVTREKLTTVVPKNCSTTNPVIFDGDTEAQTYGRVVRALFGDQNVDAVLVCHAPSSSISSQDAADAVINAAKETRRTVFVSWMGGQRVAAARHRFAEAGIPAYDTPNEAVSAFLHMFRHRRNQNILMETPDSANLSPAADAARLAVSQNLARNRTVLSGRDAAAILSAYGIPAADVRLPRTPDDAASVAKRVGFPVALSLASPELPCEVPGASARLILSSAERVAEAAEKLYLNVQSRKPQTAVHGFVVDRLMSLPGTQEVMIGMNIDPVFGPVITFGHGGPATDVVLDRAVALPPLNMSLARELISRTRISKLLMGYGGCPPANLNALCRCLVQVSQMIVDIPQIVSLRINPLFVDATGVFAGDAWFHIAPAEDLHERRLAIRPYPKELEEDFELTNGRKVLLRPIRPEDEPAHYEFLSRVSADDIRLRFFHLIRNLPHAEMARLTQIDYDREMAFIATAPSEKDGTPETLGVGRLVADFNNDKAEYAILVRSDLKGQKLGWKLMEKMIRYCKAQGTREIVGMVLRDNKRMLDLVHALGFTHRVIPEEDIFEVTLDLEKIADNQNEVFSTVSQAC